MEEATVSDRLYFCSGDISTNLMFMSSLVYYNKTLYSRHSIDEKIRTAYGYGNIYELTQEGKWTVDALMELSRDVYADNDNDGIRSPGDTYGFGSYGSMLRNFYWGAGMRALTVNEDGFALTDGFRNVYKVDAVLKTVGDFLTNSGDAYLPDGVAVIGTREYADLQDAFDAVQTGEVFVNATRMIGTDTADLNSLTRAEADGQLQTRALTEVLRANVPGFEHCFISEIQPAIGIRESRRLHGIRTLTGDALLSGEIPDDSIALGGYKIDIHSGKDRSTLFKTVAEPFGIPYGILVSRDLDNLLFAGRCVSCDRDALATIRVMPQCMNMGEAAGVGAALSLAADCAPAAVSPADVRAVLLRGGAILGMDQVRVHPEDRMD